MVRAHPDERRQLLEPRRLQGRDDAMREQELEMRLGFVPAPRDKGGGRGAGGASGGGQTPGSEEVPWYDRRYRRKGKGGKGGKGKGQKGAVADPPQGGTGPPATAAAAAAAPHQ